MTVQITDITEGPVFALGPAPDRTVYPTGIASGIAFGTVQADATIVLSGVASTVVVGTATTVATVVADGIAGGETFGTTLLAGAVNITPDGISPDGGIGDPETVATIELAGVPSGTVIGTARAFNKIFPQGIAGLVDVGSPSTSAFVGPTGIGSAVQFGDAATLATVFIIPGPFDPTNDFGNAVATKKGWVFRPPVSTYQWRLFKEYEGISLLKENGTWSEVPHPDLERTRNADLYLGGGRDHVLSTSLKNELEGLGYTVTEEIVTTEEYLS